MDGTSKKQGSIKENSNRKNTPTQNQKKKTEVRWTHNEKGWLGKYNLHSLY